MKKKEALNGLRDCFQAIQEPQAEKFWDVRDEVLFAGHTLWVESSGTASFSGNIRFTFYFTKEYIKSLPIFNKLREIIFPRHRIYCTENIELECPNILIPIATIEQFQEIERAVSFNDTLDQIKADTD